MHNSLHFLVQYAVRQASFPFDTIKATLAEKREVK
jgi:hypothetical protein